MANLIVRNIDEEVVLALKSRAGNLGMSAEALHRQLLKSALVKPVRKSFSEALKSIPSVGLDSDFERIQTSENSNVFS